LAWGATQAPPDAARPTAGKDRKHGSPKVNTQTSKLYNQLAGKLAHMKTTLDLPDDLVRAMKMRALLQGRTLRDLVADFLRQGLSMAAPQAAPAPPPGSMVETAPNGLPTIRCNANAPVTTLGLQELLALEQEAQTAEDLQRASRPV
jgi:plasmid stability protein